MARHGAGNGWREMAADTVKDMARCAYPVEGLSAARQQRASDTGGQEREE
jgi:hypothetical protein